ncbi:hypothetical protein PGIN_13-1_01308 [Porphyromonas gingivalis]|nr:hypothetical protein PGIN_13-1_01308 [Porphyromonas gingivalis]
MLIDKRYLSQGNLGRDEMREIKGGHSLSQSQSLAGFKCTCVGPDGTVVVIEAETIEECWNAC